MSTTDQHTTIMTWAEQNKMGREIARQAVKRCSVEANPTLLFREYEANITPETDRGITVGFFHELAVQLAS